MTTFWLSTDRMTIVATIDSGGIIVGTSPIARKFIGQPFANLDRWLYKQGGYRWCELKSC